MSKPNLVIVESPAKARTISSYLGKDFDVKSSLGHLRDLPNKGLGVDIKNNFKPTYEVAADKLKTVKELTQAAKGSTVWLATDEDREGEAIAWHLCEILGLDPASTNRIVFHEITEPAILEAVKKPRHIDMKLVDSQQARRILDRLVGYELSPVLWKKIRTGLSAGRVQSVAVRLLVEREKQIREFNPEASFKVTGEFSSGKDEFTAELDKKLTGPDDARQFLNDCIKASFKVASATNKPGVRNPGAPFTTSTLQQEASRRLGYGVRQTMRLAQKLYEDGHITYMRTDSTNLSPIAIRAADGYITKTFGKDYAQTRTYKTKSRSAQEAHEAIRPTSFDKREAGQDSQQQKLYELIWQRTLASQMAPARVELSEIKIGISERSEVFVAKGQVVTFDGFMKVYKSGKDDRLLPKLKEGQAVSANRLVAEEVFSRAPSRYSEAALVKKLEELGIGRPSTYAPTISTIQDRGYVEKKDVEGETRPSLRLTLASEKIQEELTQTIVGADRNKLIPTELAELVTDFLVKYFADILDYSFTARAEEELDEIADGKLAWPKMLDSFYKKLHPLVAKSNEATREEASGARRLGDDPKSGEPITARFGRFGPVLQMGETDKDKDVKPRFAPLPSDTRLEDVTLEQALPMFDLPKVVGQTEDGQEIIANVGRYGPYVKVGKLFVSIKEHNPATINEGEARQLIAAKQKEAAEREIADFGDVKILKGPYGPYITNGKKNARIPKGTAPESLSEKQARELLEKAPVKRSRRRKS